MDRKTESSRRRKERVGQHSYFRDQKIKENGRAEKKERKKERKGKGNDHHGNELGTHCTAPARWPMS